MAKSRIEAGRIEQRLGKMQSSGGSSRDPDEPQSREASSGGNTLFAFGFIAVLIVGAGALAASSAGAGFRQALRDDIMGPPAEPAYQSTVARACDKGWKDDRLNRDQIHCYMTENVARLCDPRERRALVDKLVAYQAAQDRDTVRMDALGFKMIANPGAVSKLGSSDPNDFDPNSSGKARGARNDKDVAIANDILASADQMNKDNFNKATVRAVVADVKYLVEHGYLAAEDFPSSEPQIVEQGLAAAAPSGRSSCR